MAAEDGHAWAQILVAGRYESGLDYTEAVRWYRRAAALGNGFAAKRLKKLEKRLKELEGQKK